MWPNDAICWHRAAREHQAVTWTNVDLSLVRFCGIHLRAISQQVPELLFCTMSLKIIFLKSLPHFPGFKDLKNYHKYIPLFNMYSFFHFTRRGGTNFCKRKGKGCRIHGYQKLITVFKNNGCSWQVSIWVAQLYPWPSGIISLEYVIQGSKNSYR